MKTIEDIQKQIRGIKWCIDSHKNQIDVYLNGDFNAGKIKEYAQKIEVLEAEITLLEWVLSEND